MMTRIGFLVLVLAMTIAPAAWGQGQPCTGLLDLGTDEDPVPLNLASNEVEVLAAAGDSLWVGPLQGVYCISEGEADFFQVNTVESALGGNQVSAIAARNGTNLGNRVWMGLSFDTGGGEIGTNGFLVSTDGGTSVDRRDPPLDRAEDTTIAYGGSTVRAEPVIQQASSTTRDIAFGPKGDTVWVAGLRSGLRWTTDGGTTWNRTVLPPDTRRSVDPTTPTDVVVSPPVNDTLGSFNHVVHSVLVDETGTVWTGTEGGLNRARPSDVTGDDRAWQRFTADDPGNGPPGEVVVALAEQPRPNDRNPIWAVAWTRQQRDAQRRQRFGVAVTADGGASFRQTLIGERIFDLATRQARVYAVGRNGLFISIDQGRSWTSVERFPLQNDNQTLPSDLEARSVATTPSALWVGTTEGLLRLDRSDPDTRNDEIGLVSSTGSTPPPEWELFRAQTPVDPDPPSEEAPDVSTYAYPNPFVPSRDEFVRITYDHKQPGPVTVTIYDFAMNKVKTLTDQTPRGQQETVWRGKDERGLRVPTGTYFYTVELDERTVEGKILVAN